MTIDEAIAKFDKEAQDREWRFKRGKFIDDVSRQKCNIKANEYRQLAEWLRELKELKATDVQPNKKSQWQPPLMGQGKCETYCGRCFGKIMRNSTGIFEETPFCPHCGADMRGDENG